MKAASCKLMPQLIVVAAAAAAAVFVTSHLLFAVS